MMADDPAENRCDPLTEALRYAGLGWRVVPIKKGQKFPPIVAWQKAASTDTDTIDNWWNGLYKGHGVGIATGAESGVWVLDIDGDLGRDSLDALEQRHGPLPATVEVVTGSGGRHLYFRHPGRIRISTNRSQIGAGVDVRGDGGQVLAPPTIHPNGTAYRWADGRDPWIVEVADAPMWLLELGTERLAPTTPLPPPSHASEQDSIAAWYNSTTSWDGLLLADGWQAGPTKGNQQQWTRPGKDARAGASAVLHLPDGPFVVWSTAAEITTLGLHQAWALTRDDNAWCFSRFGYYAARHHDGNRSAAARHLRLERDGDDRITAADMAALLGGSLGTERGYDVDPELREAIDDDWAPVSLVEIARAMRAGKYEPIMPTILSVRESFPLFYRERINGLFGESGGGKSWIALAAVAECLRAGLRVLLIDYEDTPAGITERLVLLGLEDDEIALLDYVSATTGIKLGVEAIERRAQDLEYALIVIDSTGEAMAAGGVEGNDDGQVARWFTLVKHLTRLPGGPCVIVLDHVPKDKEASPLFQIGSQRKKSALTGGSYRVDTLKEPAKGRSGAWKLTVAKDRLGNRPKNSTAAVVDMESIGNSVTITAHLSEAQEAEARGEIFRPTVLMERVSRWVEINPGVSQREITKNVTGKTDGLRAAIEALIVDGFMVTETGERGAICCRIERPFREDEFSQMVSVDGHAGWLERSAPVDNPETDDRAPTAPHRAPTAPQGAVTTAPRAPLPQGRGAGARSQLHENDDLTAPPVDNPVQDDFF